MPASLPGLLCSEFNFRISRLPLRLAALGDHRKCLPGLPTCAILLLICLYKTAVVLEAEESHRFVKKSHVHYRRNISLEFELGELQGYYDGGGGSGSAEQRQRVIHPCREAQRKKEGQGWRKQS
ncbi:uncharacterized protein BDR25DRAFT_382784 [Lindgomyces ingoldianus]|uniref:Uncharacterized protein n=1 Tax=Lindgomyces ingoldianus TaxID=673940 RepID=A0ACB6QAM5_9PLEO|nr:uncharacterized protein BDR25DRAFT_382784 [Lindgomyces ingoldianus]KAF2464014.1 hypothetical protein BDR25DRAFT_382784 [Lindgomyces ingoldianus]